MKKKLITSSIWVFLLGFLLLWMDLQLLFFLGMAGFFVFTLWAGGPSSDGHYTEQQYQSDKRTSIWVMTLAGVYILSGFLVLIIKTFIMG
ncbi:hypothetical protein [Alkalibacterium sp. MB6]|uniref:hypothetical protein n=1 Tax=Alkalibacterium sp. MB6 TaxID=2081965 RepID=UPI00137A2223|nr:hypothetical protein [Alkalibacterium sp. MB6]